MTSDWDVVLVGSGINSLAGAALLARAGRRALVLERNDTLGGAIRTEEITEPGFVHEVMACWHPLFVGSAAYGELRDELAGRGLEYLNTDLPTAAVLPDGSVTVLSTSHEANVAEFDRHRDGDGAAWAELVSSFQPNADLAFGILGTELWSGSGLELGISALRRLGRRGALALSGELIETCRDWLTETFQSEAVRGLVAPWVLHMGLGPDAASSAFMGKLITVANEQGGMPVPRGGGQVLVSALAGIVEDAGGSCRTGADVASVTVADGRATGVTLVGGERITATEAVVASVTPTQLYERLLADAPVPDEIRAAAGRFAYGRAGMQIHYALSEQPHWRHDERLARTAIVHVTPGLDGVSRAVNEADRGLLPAEATIACGQPTAVDPSRAPDGAAILWIQLQELPATPRGDAAGELDTGDGTWTPELRESYADRIHARLACHIENLDRAVLRRVVLSPADIETANINLVGGDIYSGSCRLDQNLLWRPRRELPGHRTSIEALFQIGASTHPGPGLGAGSGTLVAHDILRPSLSRRLLDRLPRG